METVSDEGKQRICHPQSYCRRTTKGTSLNRQEITKEKILEHQGRRKNNRKSKNMGTYNTFSFSKREREKRYMGKKTQIKYPIIIVAKLGELTLCKAFCPSHPV